MQIAVIGKLMACIRYLLHLIGIKLRNASGNKKSSFKLLAFKHIKTTL